MVAVLIGGTDRTDNVNVTRGGVSYALRLGGRGTARLALQSLTGAWRPVVGQVVEIYDNLGAKRWQGTIDEVEEENATATPALFFSATCTSMEHRFDKRLIVPPNALGSPRTDFCRLEFVADDSADKITSPGHHFAAGDRVRVSNTGGALPGGLSSSTTYWVISVLNDDVWLSTTQGGLAVDITSAGTGTHSVSWMAGAIVARLLAAAGESISAGTIDAGAVIDKVVYDNRSYSEAFDELATWSNCWWFVSMDSELEFIPRSTFSAPTNLTTDNVLSASVRNTREDYRNAQSIRVEITAISPIEETITGDGVRRTFALPYAAARVEAVTIAGEAKTLGVWGADTGSAWYWAYGDTRVIQDGTETVLGVGDTATVTYRRLGADVIDSVDTGEVAARAAVEGGSGRYDYISDDGNNTDAVSALGKAQATLAAYNGIAQELVVTTDTTGYQPGQLATVVLAKHAINGSYLITSQDVDVLPTGDDDTTILRSRLTLVGDNRVRTWVEYFQQIGGGGSGGGGTLVTGGTAVGGGSGVWQVHYATLTEDTVITPTAPAALGSALIVQIVQDGTGGWQTTWGGTVDGGPLNLNTAPNCISRVMFASLGGGTWQYIGMETGLVGS